MALYPTSELVAKAFILGIPGVPPGAAASTLPTNRDAWPHGFVVASSFPGGTSQLHVKKRQVVLDITCWFPPKPGSNRPPWHKAAQLAEKVFDAGFADPMLVQRLLTDLPDEYDHARVLAWMPGEPAKRGLDEAGNAAFGFEAEMHWIAVPK